jgi:hypothetical protein
VTRAHLGPIFSFHLGRGFLSILEGVVKGLLLSLNDERAMKEYR